MIKTLFLHPLGPTLVLALGGLLLTLGRRVRHRVVRGRLDGLSSRFGTWFAMLVVVGATTVLVLLRVPPIRADLRWVWQPLTVAGSTLDWWLNGWNWLLALLILLLTATALLLEDADHAESTRQMDSTRTLWLGAAALAFVFSGNVVTLASCWIALDVALTLRLHPGGSAEPAGRAWSLLSLTGLALLGVLALLGEGGSRNTLAGGPFSQWELGLLWLAALIRAGVYPLHFWLTGPGRTDTGDRVALHLIAPVTGLWLLARVHEVAGPGWLRRPEWAALGTLALLGTALAAWTVREEGWRWRWIVLNRASLVVLAAYVAESTGPQALVWPVVTFSLGGALLAVGQVTRWRWGWRLPVWLGALTLWGLPGTPGFLARSALIFPTDLSTAVPLFGLILVAEMLLVAALWQVAVGNDPLVADSGITQVLGPPHSLAWATLARLGLAMVLVSAPLLAWGIMPGQLANLAGLPVGSTFPTLLWLLVHTRRSVWIGLALSGLVGVGLGLLRRQIFSYMRGWQQGVVTIVSLEWLYRLTAGVLILISGGLRYFAALSEGEGYLGWLALAGLILWVLVRG